MYDSFLVRSDSLKNNVVDEKTVGFQFAVRLANYRGIFLSLVSGFYVRVDGVEYPGETQSLSVNGKPPRTLEEISKAHFEHWDLQDEGIIHIKKDGGLAPGKHVIEYMPATLDGYGYNAHDEEWIKNPPKPGTGGGGKTHNICKFELELQEV
jgi:hypothetical protein